MNSNPFENHHILANIPGGFVIMEVHDDLLLTPQYISEGFCRMLDMSLEEAFALYGKDATSGIHPDDRDRMQKIMQENMRRGVTSGDGVYRLGNRKGKYLWIKNTSQLSIEDGKPILYSIYTDITQEIELQLKLSNTTKDMKAIVDNIPGGVVKIALVNDKIVPIYVSDGWCAMMGDTKENILKLYANDAMAGVHPDDYDRVADAFTTAMKTGRPINSNYRVCNSKGVYRWINNRSSLVSDENGIANYYAVYTDITDQIEAKQKAAHTDKEMELIYNSIPGAVFKCRFNADWDVIFANDGLFRFLGYTREEFQTLFDNKMSGVIYPEDGVIMEGKISEQLKHGTSVKNEIRLICKDGSVKWISIHAELLEDENHEKYFYNTFVDITDRKKAEAALANTQQKLAVAIEHAGLTYWEYDILGNRAHLNAVAIAEYGLDEMIENYPQSLYDSGAVMAESIADYQRMIDAVKSGEKFAVADIKTLAISGEIVWKRVRFTTLFDEHERPFWAVATAETITEYKALEQQFALASQQTGTEAWIYDFNNKTITRTATTGVDYGVDAIIENVPEALIQSGAVHPDDAQIVYDMYNKMIQGQKRVSAQIRMFRADIGKYAYHQVDYTVLFDKNGKPERAIGTGIDISEKMLIEKRYQQAVEFHHNTSSENTLASGFCNITKNLMAELNTVDRVDYLAKLGYNRDKFFREISACIAEEDKRQEFLSKFLSVPIMESYSNDITQQTLECRINLADGSSKYVQFSIEILKQPDINDLTGFFLMTDHTKKKVYEKAIDAVFEKYCDFLVDVDVNKDVYTMLVAQDNLEYLPPKCGKFSRINEEYSRALADEQSVQVCLEKLSYPYILEHLSKNGSYWFYHRIGEKNEIRTKKIQVFYIDKALGHIGFIRLDVTSTLEEEQKKNEALTHALTSSERANKAKTEFLSRMSHDIRTPMNAIIGMTELCKQELDDKEKVNENLEVIDNSAKLLLSIINDVLDMSQIESGNLSLTQESFDCDAECKNVVEIAQIMFEKKQQRFEVEKYFAHDCFVGDIIRLKRVIINLLNNASKFTPDGGGIKLKATEEKTSNPQISNLVFAVSDNGIGIPKDKLEAIFRPFEQLETDAKHQGTSLGLSIVKSIVETKGGTISVDSEVGKGSTFTVRIPMRIAEKLDSFNDAAPKGDALEAIDFSNLRVLLVEDHPVNTLVAKRLLEKYGAEVDTAENGSVGYDKLTRSAKDRYNLIFMDIQMPVMNGYDATKAIRASAHPQAKSIPIIAMTANAFDEDIQKSKAAGMNAHLAKPIDPKLMYQTLFDFLFGGKRTEHDERK